jgi:hypothetical protein
MRLFRLYGSTPILPAIASLAAFMVGCSDETIALLKFMLSIMSEPLPLPRPVCILMGVVVEQLLFATTGADVGESQRRLELPEVDESKLTSTM